MFRTQRKTTCKHDFDNEVNVIGKSLIAKVLGLIGKFKPNNGIDYVSDEKIGDIEAPVVLTEEELAEQWRIAKAGNYRGRYELSVGWRTDPGVLRFLAGSKEDDIVVSVAGHPSTPLDVRLCLTEDKRKEVRLATIYLVREMSQRAFIRRLALDSCRMKGEG